MSQDRTQFDAQVAALFQNSPRPTVREAAEQLGVSYYKVYAACLRCNVPLKNGRRPQNQGN